MYVWWKMKISKTSSALEGRQWVEYFLCELHTFLVLRSVWQNVARQQRVHCIIREAFLPLNSGVMLKHKNDDDDHDVCDILSVLLIFLVFCCQLLSVMFLMKRKRDSCSFCFGPGQAVLSCTLSEKESRHLISLLSYIKAWDFWKKCLNACFTCIKKSTDLALFCCKIPVI